MELICSFCKRNFFREKCKKNSSNKYYCTAECSIKGKKKRSVVICEICNKSFEKLDKDIKRSNFNYCSRECWYKKRAERLCHCVICNLKIDCTKKYYSKKYCHKCYKNNFRQKFPEKYNKYQRHRIRIKRNLSLDHPLLRKKCDKNIGYIHNGYRIIYKKGHFAAKDYYGRILEHTYVMCEFLGRKLFKHENIHHKNGIRDDNRLENLELWTRGQPAGQRVIDRIKFYKEFLEQYGIKIDLSTVPEIFNQNIS